MKKTLTAITIVSTLLSASVYAQSYRAKIDGFWSDAGIWENNSVPGVPGVSTDANVTLDRDTIVLMWSGVYTVNKIEDPGRYNGTNTPTLIISGSETKLTSTGGLQLYYDSKLDLQILNGAEVNMGNISWGASSGNAINFTITDSVFTASFSQMQGSVADNYGKILLDGTTEATATGTWSMNPKDSGAANATATLQINGSSTLDMQKSYQLSANAVATGSTAKVLITNGGKLINGQAIGIGHNANATNIIQIYGAGSSFTNRGSNSQSLTIGTETADAVKDNAVTKLIFGGYENGTFVAADAQSMYINYEVKIRYGSSVEFILGDSNFADTMTGNSIFEGNYFKQIQGALVLDFANVGNLADGTYYVALISSTGGQSFWVNQDASYLFEDHLNVLNLGSNVIFDGLVFNGNNTQMFAQITIIPEPSTYAAIFGALAIALAAYRRRK